MTTTDSVKILKWGFDLTDLDAPIFQELIEKYGLEKGKNANKWEWVGNGLLIATTVDPTTGKYADDWYNAIGDNRKNYLGYVGVEGEKDKVMNVVKVIKNNGIYKDESRNTRSFV